MDKIIGLMIEDINTDFSKEIIYSIENSISSLKNVQFVVLAGKYNESDELYDNWQYYRIVYNSIFRLEEICRFDGLIISLSSIGQRRIKTIDTRFFQMFSETPKVYIASNLEGVVSVNYDNETGIREAVDYLVNVSGVKKLCMLGGRENNIDAVERKEIFVKCLEDNKIPFSDVLYEATDMSPFTSAAAARLLDRNPDVQAIFCVNDSVASGLYEVLKERGLVPGKDITVFGFDNTRKSSEMKPSLASIGCASVTLGQKALELLLTMIDGGRVESVRIPTRLYGRESFSYEMYEYTMREMVNVDEDFIYRMFDDCFYRYGNREYDRESVNLKRLYFEFISHMLFAVRRRFMGQEEFAEVGRMIDIFFDNGAMEYTDAAKLLDRMEKLQIGINLMNTSAASTVMINRLFVRMKDRAIQALSDELTRTKKSQMDDRSMTQNLMIEGTVFQKSEGEREEKIIKCFGYLGFQNAALYLYETPIAYDYKNMESFPETVRLRCVVKGGEFHILPKERQTCKVADIFRSDKQPFYSNGYVVFPVFHGTMIYGLLVCGLTRDISDRGESVANQIGELLYLNIGEYSILKKEM